MKSSFPGLSLLQVKKCNFQRPAALSSSPVLNVCVHVACDMHVDYGSKSYMIYELNFPYLYTLSVLFYNGTGGNPACRRKLCTQLSKMFKC